MEEIIASYLIQKGNCQLPSIGKLKRERSLAVTDVVSKEIRPPGIHYKLYPSDGDLTEGLIEYAAEKQNLNLPEARRRLEDWCTRAIERLSQNQSIYFPVVGALRKEDDNISLLPDDREPFLRPVKSVRVIHENDPHKVIVGDTETNSEEMKEFYRGTEKIQPVQWHKPALVIFLIAIILYLLYLTSGGFGNNLQPADPPATYIS